jgi:hypothetical protein
VQGSFRTCWETGQVKREEAIHPPDHKVPCPAGELPEAIAFLFSKQETVPDLKKEMPNKKGKTEEHNFRKILQRKAPSGVFCLKICNQRMSIIYGKRKIHHPLP